MDGWMEDLPEYASGVPGRVCVRFGSPAWLESSRPACALAGLGPSYTARNFYNRQINANRIDIFIFVE